MSQTLKVGLAVDIDALDKAEGRIARLQGSTIKIGLDIDPRAVDETFTRLQTERSLKLRVEVDDASLKAISGSTVTIKADTGGATNEIAALRKEIDDLKKAGATIGASASRPIQRPPGTFSQSEENRIKSALRSYDESYSAADLFAAARGTDARIKERQRVAKRIAERRNFSPDIESEFLSRAEKQALPSLFDPRRLGQRDVLREIGHAGIQGGPLAAAAGALLGATPLKGPGVLLGANAVSVGAELLAEPKRILDEVGAKIKETALNFESSVVGISASLQAATNSFDSFGNKITSIPQQLAAGEFAARQVQLAARPALSRLGVSGSAEGNTVRSLISGFAARGITFTDDQFKEVASRVVGAAVAKNPDFFQNENIATRDILDVSQAAPTAQRTQLGVALGKDVVNKIGAATSAEGVLSATRSLSAFVSAAEESNNPAVLQRRLDSQFGNLENVGGLELLQAQSAGVKEFTKALGSEDTVDAAKKLGAALGTVSDLGLRASAAFVNLGAGFVQFLEAQKNLGAVISENTSLIGQFLKPFIELSQRESDFTKSEDNVQRIRLAGVRQQVKPEQAYSSLLEKIGLKDTETAFLTDRKQNADVRLGELNQLVNRLSAGGEEEKKLLAEKLPFINEQRIAATQAVFDSQSRAFDVSTAGGKLAANKLGAANLQTQLGLASDKIASSSQGLFDASENQKSIAGSRADLEHKLALAQAETKVRRQEVQQAGPDEYLEAQTKFGESRNRENAIRTDLANLDKTAGQAQQILISQAAELLQSRREAAGVETRILDQARQRLGLEQQRTDVLKQAHDDRSILGSRANLSVDLSGARRQERTAEQIVRQSQNLIKKDENEVAALQAQIAKDTNLEVKSAHEKALQETTDRLSTRRAGLEEDQARLGASRRKTLDFQLERRLSDAGVPELERSLTGIDRGTIPGASQYARKSLELNQKRQQAITAELALASKNEKLLLSGTTTDANRREAAGLAEYRDRLQGELQPLRAAAPALERTIGGQQIEARQTFQSFRNASEQLAEAERRAQADLNNLAIAFREGKNALVDFKAALNESIAGKEEQILGSAKQYQEAGGTLPGFLQTALGDEQGFKKKFAGARLNSLLRENFGIDDQTLLAGPNLGLPGGTRFAQGLTDQESKLRNSAFFNEGGEDRYKLELRNRREAFANEKAGVALKVGSGLNANGFSDESTDSLLTKLESEFAKIDRRNLARRDASSTPANPTTGSGIAAPQPSGTPAATGQGTTPGSATNTSKIDSADMDRLATKIAAAVSVALNGATGAVG